MKIKNILIKAKNFILSHKIISSIILIVLIASPFAINHFLPKKQSLSYATQIAKTGNISVSVSGTGQVSSLKEVNLSAEVSGKIKGVYVENGEKVNKGDLLFKINDTEGLQSVRTAKLALEQAQIDLEEMKAPVDELTLLQSENSLIQAEETKRTAENNLTKSYDDGFNNVSNAFLDLPGIMLGLDNVLFSTTIAGGNTQSNIYYFSDAIRAYDSKIITYQNELIAAYNATKKMYDQNFLDYKNSSRYSEKETIESLIDETYATTKKISDTIKLTYDYIQYYKEVMNNYDMTPTSYADTYLTTLNGYTSKTNSHLSTLLSSGTTIDNYKSSIISAERTIKEKELSLEDAKEGSTDLEIRTQELTVSQKEEALLEAQEDLAKYSITAPFDGVIASVDVFVGDTVSTGTSMGSIITNDKIADITLNEIDIAKIKLGQKVDITFDALDDLSIVGEVAEIDTLGTVSQGVVSYNVKISFDTEDERVKPGMSITANIIVESVNNVITIPSSAIKTMGDKNFVQVMLNDGKIERKNIEIGITDDVFTEIKNGINEGDKIVVQTSTNTKKTTTTNKSTNQNQGGPQGGDMMMIMGR